MRNFLDDPRRCGPAQEEGSRRHGRNWGGPDFEGVRAGMEREKVRFGVRKRGFGGVPGGGGSGVGAERWVRGETWGGLGGIGVSQQHVGSWVGVGVGFGVKKEDFGGVWFDSRSGFGGKK